MAVYIFALVFLVGVGADETYFRRLDALKPEEPCSKVGGTCTFAEDCPQLAESGLCPQQRSLGVECCYGISVRETRCGKHGGQCMLSSERCGPEFKEATDCPSGYKCCILV